MTHKVPGHSHSASQIPVSTGEFNGTLTASDNTVQKALEALDGMSGLYPPSWKYDPDEPAASPDAMDDHFDAIGLDAKWSTVNYVAGTTSTMGSGRYNIYDAARNTRLVGIEQAISGSSWTIAAKFEIEGMLANYNGAGLSVKDSVSGRYLWLGLMHHSSYGYLAPLVINLSDAVTYTSEVYTAVCNWSPHYYLKLVYDGTNFDLYQSISGLHFIKVISVAKATYLNAAPTHVGLMQHHYGAALSVSFDWFRRLA